MFQVTLCFLTRIPRSHYGPDQEGIPSSSSPPGEHYDLLRGKQQECIILHTGQFPPCSLINTSGIILTIWISQLPCQLCQGELYKSRGCCTCTPLIAVERYSSFRCHVCTPCLSPGNNLVHIEVIFITPSLYQGIYGWVPYWWD